MYIPHEKENTITGLGIELITYKIKSNQKYQYRGL